MSGRVFVDTNIIVYAHTSSEKDKCHGQVIEKTLTIINPFA